MDKKQRRRFNTLIRFMRSLPARANKHFYMGHWFDHVGPDIHPGLGDDSKILTRQDLALCGTSACALGWASVCPSLKRAGLSMTLDGTVKLNGRSSSGGNIFLAMRFFGLPESAAIHLFSRTGVTTPKQWAREAKIVLENPDEY